MRILFLGTPQFATIPLRALAEAGHQIVGVVTQPDRAAGRSLTPQAPPVKIAALQLGLQVLQPATLKDEQAVAALSALEADVGVVAAYGEILRNNVLAIPPLGYLNLHPSLLPQYRGPTPVAASILAGDEVGGVSIIRLVRAMDAGPILAQATLAIAADARTGPLTDELFRIGAQLLVGVLPLYATGELEARPQDDSRATYCKLLSKAEGQIDWSLPALVIERAVRAYDPWPGAFTSWNGKQLRIVSSLVDQRWQGDQAPGTVLEGATLRVATGSGALEIGALQPAGGRAMPGADWLRGQRSIVGAVLGSA